MKMLAANPPEPRRRARNGTMNYSRWQPGARKHNASRKKMTLDDRYRLFAFIVVAASSP
jgi:hypothetical protein